ncbi:hypothetical protein QC763_601850 [Podospora pseudopauciseta]|uniref:Uncharacterized protein n=1 Tax=Podospora pseudopauciseta TaxID=2093780 RepID=A0ABR0H4F5_9PEZI|nr:hypothetical protein QC763_601850 [Podospora pseudopauciseta]
MDNDNSNSRPDFVDHSARNFDRDSDHDPEHGSEHNPDTPSDCPWVGFCVPRRCRLCTYPIEPNEWMVATLYSAFVNNEHSIEDVPRLKEEFRPCPPACAHDQSYLNGSVPVYHAEYFDYAGNPRHDLLTITSFSFEPLPLYDIKRKKRMVQLLATKMGDMWCHLPHELCLMISELVVGKYTVLRYNNCILPVKTYTTTWISRKPSGHAQCCRRLYDPEMTPEVNIFYVLEDHLGMRDLLFSSTESKQMNLSSDHLEPGFWWRVLSSPQVLQAEYDVSASYSPEGTLGRPFSIYKWRGIPKYSECANIFIESPQHDILRAIAAGERSCPQAVLPPPISSAT